MQQKAEASQTHFLASAFYDMQCKKNHSELNNFSANRNIDYNLISKYQILLIHITIMACMVSEQNMMIRVKTVVFSVHIMF